MLSNANNGETRADSLKWVTVTILLLAGLVTNYYYMQLSLWIRLSAWAALVLVVAFISSKTQRGKWFISFFRDSRLELRKVVWPTREETTQTTIVVAVMVVVLALILWGMDSVLVSMIGWLTGQKG